MPHESVFPRGYAKDQAWCTWRREKIWKSGVASLAGAVGDLLAEAGLFKADFSFFDLGRQTTGLESFLGLLNGSLGAAHVDIFGLFGDLGHDRYFGWCDFRIAPEYRHVAGQIPDAVAQLADA